jgi:hypothetical protein
MRPPLRAFIVCVDYSDLLRLTLDYNRHHFDEVIVVTTKADRATHYAASSNNAYLIKTEKFYENGAHFNKFAALEHALDTLGRHGWLCIMDADVLWPKHIDWKPLEIGNLYTPFRRMCVDIPDNIPQEPYWKSYPLHPQQVEWAGYTQIFHGDDPALPSAPWHQTNWRHAGGADSFFQRLWPQQNKLRPPFEVLHLGPAGVNWCGRATPYLNGDIPDEANNRKAALRHFIQQRKLSKSFDSEKL